MHEWRVALVGVLALGSAAHAEPGDRSDTRESELLYTATPLRSDELGFAYHADALAAALATSGNGDAASGGLGTASAELAVTGAGDCDAVTLGGQLTGRTDERTLSAQQWASVCPLGGDGWIKVDHRLEWDVTPRLLAAPRLRTGPQRREAVALEFFGSERPLHEVAARLYSADGDPGLPSLVPPKDWLQGGHFRLEMQFGWTERGWNDLRVFFDIVLMNWRHQQADGSSFVLAIFAPRMDVDEAIDSPDEAGAASLGVDLGRIDGVRLGPVRLGGRLGGRVGGMSIGRDATYQQLMLTVGEAGVSVERELLDGVTLRLGGDRRSWPTSTGGMAVDDRATLALVAERGRLRGTLELAAATTHLINVRTRKNVGNGGLTADLEYDLGHHLAIAARSEAGKAAYAQGALYDEPRWASETQLMLATHAGHRYQRGRARRTD